MQPLYFLPRATDALRKTILKHGLGYVFDDVPDEGIASVEITGKSPAGNVPGYIVAAASAAGKAPRDVVYKPQRQTWQQVPGDSGVWIGVSTGDPPGPADIERRGCVNGYMIELGDGRDWLCPVLRRPDGTSNMPRSYRFDDAGGIHDVLDGKYRELWDRSEQVVDLFGGDECDADEVRQWALPLCIDALSLNYRFGVAEQNATGLLTSSNWLAVLMALVGWYDPSVRASLKKTATSPASVSSTPGQPDDCPITDQPDFACTD